MLEKIFNIKIPYGYFYQAQTVYYLAQAIQSNNFNRPLKWLSLINQGGGVPIYWLLNGEDTLRKHLPDDQEIYRINTHYDHDMPDRKLTVEGICNEFVKEILQINRGDRCIVGGFSMGARFAYEIAKQLKKSGINIDLLILLDPSEPKAEKQFKLGDTYQQIKSLYYIYTNSLPADKREHIYQFYKYLKNKHSLSQYDGKVLLMQRVINVAFEERDWPKITDDANLIFSTLEIDDHLEVVNDENIQLHWVNKIKEHIYGSILNLPLVFLDPLFLT
jgi:pimeloyl-ACP methyl ester carboxylesterase